MIATETTMTPKETTIADKLLQEIEDAPDEHLMYAIEAYHKFLEAASIRRSMDRRVPFIPSHTATWGVLGGQVTQESAI